MPLQKIWFQSNIEYAVFFFGKSSVGINGFHDVARVMNTYLTATPNNALSVEKIRSDFQISTRNLCQTYSLVLTVGSEPTCTNWEIKTNLTFLLRSLDTNSIFCQYNSSDITIRTSACYYSGVYYNVIIESGNVPIGLIQKLTFLNKWIKLQAKFIIIASLNLVYVVVRDVEKKNSLFVILQYQN